MESVHTRLWGGRACYIASLGRKSCVTPIAATKAEAMTSGPQMPGIDPTPFTIARPRELSYLSAR